MPKLPLADLYTVTRLPQVAPTRFLQPDNLICLPPDYINVNGHCWHEYQRIQQPSFKGDPCSTGSCHKSPSLLIHLTILFNHYKQVARQRVPSCLKSVDVELIAFTRALRQGQRVPVRGHHRFAAQRQGLNRALWYDFWRRGIVDSTRAASQFSQRSGSGNKLHI